MKLLLIDPVTTAETVSVTERTKLRQGIGYPGLGLLTVAALTPEDVEVRYIDESVEDIDFDYHPDMVGITVQAPTAPYAYRLAAQFRNNGTTVILGGIHVSLNTEEALPHADAVVVGEAELTWPGLLQDYNSGQLKKLYRARSLAELERSPIPRRDLLKTDRYFIPHVVQASKGCPYGCDFCSLHAYVGQPPRYRLVPSVIDELAELPSDNFIFADDNLYSDPAYTEQLLKNLAPLNKRWAAEATWHIAYDNEILKLARQSGCIGLFVGFDSINNRHRLRKVPQVGKAEEIYVNAIKNIVDHGIAVVAAFVFGLDEDDESVFERSLQVVLDGGANLVNFSCLVPYPGTPVHERLKREDRLIESDLSKYISPNVCFAPRMMSPERLNEGVIWAQKEFYSYQNILKTSLQATRKLGWGMGLFALRLNLAQKANWGKGSDEN
ncbi:MAG: B12-binding domain-containing radical SAM protein [Candidatus Zixiibacteriota bacterium]|nr:MAG: B12-binding domain-containing radical SAM protein [candidate division Zixibacteria bacterium]